MLRLSNIVILQELNADCARSLANVTASKCAVTELVESYSAHLTNQSAQSQDHVIQWSNQLQTELGNRVEDVHAFLQEKMKKDIPTGNCGYFHYFYMYMCYVQSCFHVYFTNFSIKHLFLN